MQGDGEWGLQSVHNSLLLLSLHVLHLLQHGLSPMGYGSSWTSPCVFSLWKAPEWVSPSGCSPSGTEFPGHPKSCQQNLFPANTFLQASVSCWDPTPALAFQGLQFQGGYLLHCGSPWDSLHHELQRNLYSTVWITSSLFFVLDLGVCRILLTYISHSSLQAAVAQKFVP